MGTNYKTQIMVVVMVVANKMLEEFHKVMVIVMERVVDTSKYILSCAGR